MYNAFAKTLVRSWQKLTSAGTRTRFANPIVCVRNRPNPHLTFGQNLIIKYNMQFTWKQFNYQNSDYYEHEKEARTVIIFNMS